MQTLRKQVISRVSLEPPFTLVSGKVGVAIKNFGGFERVHWADSDKLEWLFVREIERKYLLL